MTTQNNVADEQKQPDKILDEDTEHVDQVDPIAQNIEVIANLHIKTERKVGRTQRAIERVTAFLGRPRFLAFILVFVLLWILANDLANRLGYNTFDPPPFYWLQGMVGLGALLMTTMVLITQNRQNMVTEQRRRLDLQVNLVVEQKVTKLVELIEELRHDLPNVQNRHDPEAEAMKEPVDPHQVLKTLNQMVKETTADMQKAPGKNLEHD